MPPLLLALLDPRPTRIGCAHREHPVGRHEHENSDPSRDGRGGRNDAGWPGWRRRTERLLPPSSTSSVSCPSSLSQSVSQDPPESRASSPPSVTVDGRKHELSARTDILFFFVTEKAKVGLHTGREERPSAPQAPRNRAPHAAPRDVCDPCAERQGVPSARPPRPTG
jgi:hypothetical protein